MRPLTRLLDHRPRLLGMVSLLLIALAVTGCTSSTSAVTLVDAGRAETLMETQSDLVVLDIRTPEEVAEGVLPGAMAIDFYSASFRDRLEELDRDVPYLVYCRSGNRSADAVTVMTDLGFTEIYELDGGIGSWVGAGRSLVAG